SRMPQSELADDLFDLAAGIPQKFVFDAHRFIPHSVEAPLLDETRVEPRFLDIPRHHDLRLPEDGVVEAADGDAVDSAFGFELLALGIQPTDSLDGADDRHLGRAAGP